MTGLSESELENKLEDFLSGRDIYTVHCSGDGEWREWKRERKTICSSGTEDAREVFTDEIDQGDVLIAQKDLGEIHHTYGIGVVSESYDPEQPALNPEADQEEDPENSKPQIRTHWVTAASNGEEITGDIPEEFPSEETTEVDTAFFRDLLIGLDEESFPPPGDELVSKLFEAAALTDINSLLDTQLPAAWKRSQARKEHIKRVAEEFLTETDLNETTEERRQDAQVQAVNELRADIETAFEEIQRSCGEDTWASHAEDTDDYQQECFDPALERIEEAWSHGYPWETGMTVKESEFSLSKWLRESLENDYEYFILKTGDEEYDDEASEFYHFKENIPGSRQLPEAGEHARFVYLEDNEFYAVGSIGDIESESRDGTEHFFAQVDEYHEINEIDRGEVEDQLSKDFPIQYGIIKIADSDYEHILRENLDQDTRAAIANLLEEEGNQAWLYREALAHLAAGKNIVFYGPPGTGKTRAARKLSGVICDGDYSLVTANAEWSNYQVVGGYAPSEEGFKPQPGFLTEAAQECKESLNSPTGAHPSWLLIDELNRANLDEAFGDVFTLLDVDYRNTREISYAPNADSVPLPLSFRILATMNTYDQAQLFSLGYAFRRRFAFVRVPSLMDDRNKAPETSSPSVNPAQDKLTSGSQTTIDIIRGTLTDDLLLGSNDQQGVSPRDVAAVLDDLADSTRINDAIERLDETDEFRTGTLDWVETMVYFAQETMDREVIEIGQALLIDAAKFVVAHELLFPEETDRTALDQAVVSYIVPQFEHFMPKLRRAETIDQDSTAIEDFDEIINLASQLGLPETVSVLTSAKEDKRILE